MKTVLTLVILFLGTAAFGQLGGMPVPGGPGGGSSESLTPLEAPPHKGVVKPAGKYYIEIVVNWMLSKNNTTLYLLKSGGKPMPVEKVRCTTEMVYNQDSIVPTNVIELTPESHGTHLDPDHAYQLKVTYFVKKKKYTAMFQTKGSGNNTP